MSLEKIDFTQDSYSLDFARALDEKDELKDLRQEFHYPKKQNGEEQLYFAGHSLGLMPKQTSEYIQMELEDWSNLGVEGHFHARHPWMPYHELITSSFAKLMGAKESEVVAMNTLTVNLHLMLVSFYRPTKKRFKILIENNTFPSDKYAVDSQARYHGFDPNEAIVELTPEPNGKTVCAESILQTIEDLGDELALVMLGNCNYLSGQMFDMKSITEAAHKVGAQVGFNLAHGAGNIQTKLHDWNVDFAVWCSYKYLNSGPGGLAGAFVHEVHLGKADIPRFEGWWGHDKTTRFEMGPNFEPINTAEAWQLSNPPIFQLASLRSSMEIFDRVGMEKLRAKSSRLTSFFEGMVRKNLEGVVEVVTPESRGSMLCLEFKSDPRAWYKELQKRGAILDFREPNILRATPVALYNSFEDVYKLVDLIKEVSHG